MALTVMWQTLGIMDAQFRSFIMLYLSMEEWMHGVDTKEEVRSDRPLISRVLRLFKNFREGKAMDGAFRNITVCQKCSFTYSCMAVESIFMEVPDNRTINNL